MTHNEIIAVVAAHAAGEEIQSRQISSDNPWKDTADPSWNFAYCDFRVKPKPPKPREWWIGLRVDGTSAAMWNANPVGPDATSNLRIVHVREVLGGEP